MALKRPTSLMPELSFGPRYGLAPPVQARSRRCSAKDVLSRMVEQHATDWSSPARWPTFGVSRGFSEFQRYGFFKRAGKAHYAAALSRRRATSSRGAALLADLDMGGWLDQTRRFGRDENQPATVRNAVKTLEDSVFDLLAPDVSHRSVRAALQAIGRLANWLSASPTARQRVTPPARSLSQMVGASQRWHR